MPRPIRESALPTFQALCIEENLNLADCKLKLQGGSVQITCADIQLAKDLWYRWRQRLAYHAQCSRLDRITVLCEDKTVFDAPILPLLAERQNFAMNANIPINLRASDIRDLDSNWIRQASGQELELFALQNPQVPMVATSMLDNSCLFATTPQERTGMAPHRLRGINWLTCWRNTLDQHGRLVEIMLNDGKVFDYEHTLERPGGGRGRYWGNFFFVENYYGEPVRFSLSNQEWELLSPA